MSVRTVHVRNCIVPLAKQWRRRLSTFSNHLPIPILPTIPCAHPLNVTLRLYLPFLPCSSLYFCTHYYSSGRRKQHLSIQSLPASFDTRKGKETDSKINEGKGKRRESRNPIDRNHMISRSRKISGLEKTRQLEK